jgi:hypothetical protein
MLAMLEPAFLSGRMANEMIIMLYHQAPLTVVSELANK